tara:strand:- start:3360 stop:4682 length:1323 start_codon:yes stop_codon:yes gene_type:complete
MKGLAHPTTRERPETCVLVGVEIRPSHPLKGDSEPLQLSSEESLAELSDLAIDAGADVLGKVIQNRKTLDPAMVIGRGKVEELRMHVVKIGADIVIFDQNLSPTQQRNLERHLSCSVLDRTQLILHIFARHARTVEGRLQVELAQLHYALPRLTGHGASMSRLGAGIGTRGPGETKLETDRRRISRRMEKLAARLESVRKTRKLQRERRSGIPLATVILAGYTNAGKSTLFNTLTTAEVITDSRMFSTLDPTLRVLNLPSQRRIILSDTVGFISRLPPTLIQAFRATLEEVTSAAMILHVVDATSQHRMEYMNEVEKILAEIGVKDKPHLLVFNKIDLLEPSERETLLQSTLAFPRKEVVAISALQKRGLKTLLGTIDQLLPNDEITEVRYRFSHRDGNLINFLYDNAHVVERIDTPECVEVAALASESVRRKLIAHATH